MKNEEIKREIEKNITKQSKRILLVLYYMKKSYSGDLADYFEINRNTMSNRLERLRNLPQKLIVVKKTGRQKEYSLTTLGEEYVRDFLDNEQERDKLMGAGWSYASQMEDGSITIIDIKECQKELEEVEPDWEEKISEALKNGIWNGTSKDLKDLKNGFEKLIYMLLKVKIEKNEEIYSQSIKGIKSKNAKKCIDNIICRRESLNILWDLAAEDWERAYDAIDILFLGDDKDFIITEDIIDALCEKEFTRREARDMSFAMMEIITIAKKNELLKEEMYALLVNEGADNNQFVYYIAEKYKSRFKSIQN